MYYLLLVVFNIPFGFFGTVIQQNNGGGKTKTKIDPFRLNRSRPFVACFHLSRASPACQLQKKS